MIEWSDVDIAVRDAVREFVDKEIRPHVDALESGEMEPYPIVRKLFATFGIADMSRDSLNKRLAKLRDGGESSGKSSGGGGMFGDGTGGMGFVVVSELCRVSMGIVTGMGVSLGLTVPTIRGRGTLAQQERWLPDLVTYDKIGAWAITEPDSGSDAFGGMKSYVVRDGDDYILNGQKTFITNGPDADVVVVYAKLDEGRRRRQARPQGPHVRPRPRHGGLRPVKAVPQDGYSQFTHRGTVLQQRTTRPRQAARRNRGQFGRRWPRQRAVEFLRRTDRGRGDVAGCHRGMPSAMRRLRQGPHALGSGNRAVPAHSAQAGEHGSRPNERAQHPVPGDRVGARRGNRSRCPEASAIKWYCSQAATDVAMEAVQLFGGNGYMTEYRVEQLARDAKSLMIYAGSNEVQITHVARGLLNGG